MSNLRGKLLSSTVFPVVLGLGAVGVIGISISAATAMAMPYSVSGAVSGAVSGVRAANPAAAPNPTAAPNGAANGYLHLIRGCNPCAAKNPCGARHGGCNPCNPCAASNPCNPCNPCAAAAGGASACTVPRLVKMAASNPCAAKNPCNPCAAKNPCNPCAAKNPCNPCAASNPCNPCGPCGAAPVVELTAAEATAAYNCAKGELKAGYGKSGLAITKGYQTLKRFNTVPYRSATHGNRFVNNYTATAAYGKFEDAGTMPKGTVIAKDSFNVTPNGSVKRGPLFLMEKMSKGFDKETGNWRYTMVMANGKIIGTTGGKGARSVGFCADCHAGVEDQDYLFFLPDDYRK